MSPIFVRPIKVQESETVEIQWTCQDGTIHHERYTCPPKAVREARRVEEDRNILPSPGLY